MSGIRAKNRLNLRQTTAHDLEFEPAIGINECECQICQEFFEEFYVLDERIFTGKQARFIMDSASNAIIIALLSRILMPNRP